MPGSPWRLLAYPRPYELIGRLIVASVLVLWPLHELQRFIVEPLLPVCRAVVSLLDARLEITQATVIHEEGRDALRFGVNLAAPLGIAAGTVYPFGWYRVPPGGLMPDGQPMPRGGSVPRGEYRVDCSVAGMLVYGALSLIVILAWPVRRAREVIMRLVAVVGFWALFLVFDVPAYVLGVVWDVLLQKVGNGGSNGWLLWRAFLADGGGVALGLVVAATAIVWAQRFGVRRNAP